MIIVMELKTMNDGKKNRTNLWLTVFVVVIGLILFMVSFNPATNSSDVDSANIVNSSIQEEDLKLVNSAFDEECLTYEEDIGDFEWQDCITGAASDDALTLVYRALKQTTGTIPKGSVVKVVGYSVGSDAVLVELADASDPALMPAIGVSRTEMTAVTVGEVVAFGRADNIDTTSYPPGVPLYVGTTPGSLTSTRPGNGYLVQSLAVAIRIHASQGRMGVVGAGRANDLPNLDDDYVWLGSTISLPTQTLLPDCDVSALARLQYDTTANAFACVSSAIDLTSQVTGDLPVAEGGTGVSSLTDHGILLGSGSSAVSVTTVGTTGQVLTGVTGSDPVWAAAAGGGAGIEVADQWRLHTSFDGNAAPIATNLERVDTDGFGQLGTGVTESGGIFTFPETGIWYITFTALSDSGGGTASTGTSYRIVTTTNDSTYDTASYASVGVYAANVQHSTSAAFIFDVTSTSTHKVRFDVADVAAGNGTLGSSDRNFTYMTFLKLGDT